VENEIKKRALTVAEMGKSLGISYPTALELTERADFPCIRCGRRKVIPVDGFEKWLEKASLSEGRNATI